MKFFATGVLGKSFFTAPILTIFTSSVATQNLQAQTVSLTNPPLLPRLNNLFLLKK
jgi:lipopolysaccharide export system protein LptC